MGTRRYTADHIALLDHLRIDRCRLYGQRIGGSFILNLTKPLRARVRLLRRPPLRIDGPNAVPRAGRQRRGAPDPISEELSKLLPNCEFIPEWKSGPALTVAKARVKEFLAKHTPTRA